MGGSETAAMEMSRLLTARGNRVRLYGDCAGIEGTFSGVEYIHYSKFKDLSCDVLMISRRPSAVDAPGIERKATLCWVHDIHCGPDLTHERALKIDKFLTLSNWHKDFFFSQYDFLHPSQVSVTRNGINLSRFNLAIPRNPHRAVYSSSPDRGMEVAVRSWNLVRKRIPDAELHIYYGFQTWEACIGNDQNQRDTVQRLKKLLAENAENGVFYHGRVDQKTLAREYLASGVWAYPSGFSETSCISAMEAHAAGLRMITSPIAALNETVGNRGVMIYGDWLSEDYGRKFVDAVVSAMTNPDLGDRNVLQTYARENFSWEGVASDWDQMLRKTIDLVSENKVVQYRGSR
jgi:glycosyltransferase involved in cell wall biosynthesis